MTIQLTIEALPEGSFYAGGAFGINAIGDTREAVIEEAHGQARDLAEARGIPVPVLNFIGAQEPLGADLEAIWDANKGALYEA